MRASDDDALKTTIPLNRVSGRTHEPEIMPGHHLHHHLELNYVHDGWVVYSFLGRQRRVGAGVFTAFWAAVPHRLVEAASATRMSWFTVPLPYIGSSRLAGLLTRLFQGAVISDAAPRDGDDRDATRWSADLSVDSEAMRTAATLEILARLIRIAATEAGAGDAQSLYQPADAQRKIGAMLDYIHESYAHTVTVADIAGHACLSPDYAGTIFHSAIGLTPTQYLLTIRIYRACQLLVETSRGVTDIALSSGFRAVSSFYEVFHRIMGVSPGEIRKSVTENLRGIP